MRTMKKLLFPVIALVVIAGGGYVAWTLASNMGSGDTTDPYGYDASSASSMDAMAMSSMPSAMDSTSSAPSDMMGDSSSTPSDTMPSTEPLSGMHTVVLKTSMGDITLELDADAAPKTVTNFVTLSKQGYYDGIIFHRVIPGFMIQGGDPLGNGTGGESIYGPEFEDEPNDLQMVRGAIAMANRGPNTNGSQFFIVQAEATPWLQGRHTVFGRVSEGLDIVDAIANVERGANDKPVTPVTFTPEVRE